MQSSSGREAGLRQLERRLRVRSDAGVDVRDLKVHADYIDAVLSTGATLRTASRWLNAVSIEAGQEQIEFISTLPFVTGTRRVQSGVLNNIDIDYGNATQQLGLIGVPDLHACGLTGEGVVVGLLDTGFSTAHQAFAHLVVQAEHDFVNDDGNTADEAGDPAGQDEHGTKVLSLLAGLDPDNYAGAAPYVAVVLAKIDNLAVDDPAESDWWVAGLEWIESQGADLASGSIGFCAACPPENMDGQTEPTTIAAAIAVENGLIVVNSAGNRGPDPMTLNAPADAPTSDYGWGRIRGLEAAGLYCSCQDTDADGHFSDTCGGDDCDDENAAIHPDATEACNGRDDDCDGNLLAGEEDNDSDGHLACNDDCDDDDNQVHPGAEDLCNDGVDSDCDGEDPECEVEGCGCSSTAGGSGCLLLLVFLIARRGSDASRRR